MHFKDAFSVFNPGIFTGGMNARFVLITPIRESIIDVVLIGMGQVPAATV